jgi:hypothetical protein
LLLAMQYPVIQEIITVSNADERETTMEFKIIWEIPYGGLRKKQCLVVLQCGFLRKHRT